ncbi:MAG TPA: sigma-70 family RNA polymerase sigma factor [Polyangiaceae bacterium]|jgi:RNA polymerase sigma-70 factor (ECF subfamily)
MRSGGEITTDVELLRRIAEGDVLAVAELYDRHARMLLALSLRIVRQRSDAEDVVHDAFVVVGERARQYVPERGAVGAWLVTLVRNLSIDRTRRRERRGAIARDVLAHDPEALAATAPVDPETKAAGAADRERVRSALAALPEVQRATLETAFYEGLTYAEIAEREGVPLGTIKSRAARGLAALREALGDER